MLSGPVSGIAGSRGSKSQSYVCFSPLGSASLGALASDLGWLSPHGRKEGRWQLATRQEETQSLIASLNHHLQERF